MNETREIECWLLKKGELPERLVTEAKVLADESWKDRAEWQAHTYHLVRAYGRMKLKEDLKAIENRLFYQSKYSRFQNIIHSIFSKE